VLIRREYKSFFLPCSSLGSESSERRSAELHGAEAEADRRRSVARVQLFEFSAAFRGEESSCSAPCAKPLRLTPGGGFCGDGQMLAKKILRQRRCPASSCVARERFRARVGMKPA